MILNIFGGGGSGKTTLQFALLDRGGFTNLVPYTTRQRRPGEQDGIHYRFVTPEQFRDADLVLQRFDGGALYGVALQDLRAPGIVITTFDLNGIFNLERMAIDAKIVFLNISEPERIARMLRRGDDRELVLRRAARDHERIHAPNTIYPVLEIKGGRIDEVVEQVVNFVISK